MKIGKLQLRWGSKKPSWVSIDKTGNFYHYIGGLANLSNNVKGYCNDNAYQIATTLAEVFIPIDMIADRVSSVDYKVVNSEGVDVEKLNTNVSRLIDKPNAFQSLESLIYQIQFNIVASGGAYLYPVFTTKTKNESNLQALYCINPDNIYTTFKQSLLANSFLIDDYSEVVQRYTVDHFNTVRLQPDDLMVDITGGIDYRTMKPKSQLEGVEKNINNLLAVYQARYKNYVHNGSAGIIARKQGKNGDLEQFETEQRQNMVDEMNATDGVTGNKNFIGISSIPLDFIETLGKIKDLEPFKETMHDLITIGGALGIDKDLLPRPEGTTFNNKEHAELHLWQNEIIPRSKRMAKRLTKMFYLPEGLHFEPDFSGIQVLQSDRKTELQADLLELQKDEKLKELGVNINLEKWEN